MRRVEKKKRENKHPLRFIYSPKLFALLGVIILVAISVPLARSLKQKSKVEKEVNNIKEEIRQFRSKNKDLDKLVEYLKSDQFIEEKARVNFDMKKKGEKVVVVKEEGKVAGASTSSEDKRGDTTSKNSSNPQKWLSYFFEK